MTQEKEPPVLQVDIVSDVMCPWCIVGFRQLEQALGQVGVGAYIRWHPFELNPDMPAEGQNLREHITQKYGITDAQSEANRENLQKLGSVLGIDFNFTDESRIVNTFKAHQLLGWAQEKGLQHPLKLALFEAHFTQGKDLSRDEELLGIVESVGLDRAEAQNILQSGDAAKETRAAEVFWTSRGISGVPAMVFDGKYLVTGAQGVDTYAQILRQVLNERAAA